MAQAPPNLTHHAHAQESLPAMQLLSPCRQLLSSSVTSLPRMPKKARQRHSNEGSRGHLSLNPQGCQWMTAREVVQVRKEALQVQPLLAILARFGIRKGKRWRQPIFLMHTYTNVPAFFRIIVPWYQCTHTTSNATCATHVACTIAQLYPIKTSPYKTRMITPRCLKHATPVCFMRKIIEQCNFCVSSFMILI